MTDDLFDSAGKARLERLRERVRLLENQAGDLTARLPAMRGEAAAVGAELDEIIGGHQGDAWEAVGEEVGQAIKDKERDDE